MKYIIPSLFVAVKGLKRRGFVSIMYITGRIARLFKKALSLPITIIALPSFSNVNVRVREHAIRTQGEP